MKMILEGSNSAEAFSPLLVAVLDYTCFRWGSVGLGGVINFLFFVFFGAFGEGKGTQAGS